MQNGYSRMPPSPRTMTAVNNGSLSPTPRSTLRRHRERAAAERTALYDVLDSTLMCHLAVVVEGAPLVLPTGFGRDAETLYVHGSTGARSLRAAAAGIPVCVTVTRLDGVVYARSAFHHSMNFASAVIHGAARQVADETEKTQALRAIVEHLSPGSWGRTRQPNRRELAATQVLAIPLAEASVKIRTGPPLDDEADLTGDVWAGVLPIRQVFGAPQPCPLISAPVPVPEVVSARVSWAARQPATP